MFSSLHQLLALCCCVFCCCTCMHLHTLDCAVIARERLLLLHAPMSYSAFTHTHTAMHARAHTHTQYRSLALSHAQCFSEMKPTFPCHTTFNSAAIYHYIANHYRTSLSFHYLSLPLSAITGPFFFLRKEERHCVARRVENLQFGARASSYQRDVHEPKLDRVALTRAPLAQSLGQLALGPTAVNASRNSNSNRCCYTA